MRSQTVSESVQFPRRQTIGENIALPLISLSLSLKFEQNKAQILPVSQRASSGSERRVSRVIFKVSTFF